MLVSKIIIIISIYTQAVLFVNYQALMCKIISRHEKKTEYLWRLYK